MKLKDFLELVNYQITDTSKFQWKCFGDTAATFEYWNGIHDFSGHSISVVFDTVTTEVYEMQAWDYSANREYRWINPEYTDFLRGEFISRSISFEESMDGRLFIDLDLEEDILEKARAIYAGKEYDTRVMVSIDLPDDLLYAAMRLAHEQDITFNEYIEQILKQEMDRLKGTDASVSDT